MLANIQDEIREILQEGAVRDEIHVKIETLLTGDGPYGKIFEGLETNHLQLKFYKEHFHMVVS